jgi:hypothetical protein
MVSNNNFGANSFKIAVGITILALLQVVLSGCIESPESTSATKAMPPPPPIPTQIQTVTPKPTPTFPITTLVYGYITTISLDNMQTEFIDILEYDKYEVEENVGTVIYRGNTFQTNRVIFWKGDTKKTINNVIEYELTNIVAKSAIELAQYASKVRGCVTSITLDKMKTELIKIEDNYNNYEIEQNVGTANYGNGVVLTHRVTLWRGKTKIVINNVVSYSLT